MNPNPEIIPFNAAFTTNVAANTASEDTVLAAPGAGLRYRIYAVDWSETQNNAANVMRHFLYGGAGNIGSALATATIQPGQDSHRSFYTQGVPLPANTALINRTSCTIGAQTYRLSVHYIIETV